MFSDDSLAGSFHNDVLHAEPTSIDGKERLVEELKNRAKGAISSRSFPIAVQLYSKAIDVLPETDRVAHAVLRGNRSMCFLSMGNASSALADAEEAERLDASYVKVYYRKAAALKALSRFGEARNAILKGLDIKGDDKDMKALLLKIESDISSQGSKAATAVPAARTTVTTQSGSTSAATSAKTTTTSSSSAMKSKSASAPAGSDEAAEEEDDDEALGNLRGYKKTADGRVTTFFNNELDETAKRLIGDIAPKKLQAAEGAAAAATETVTANGSSAWNSAGTYEERLLSPWASAELRSRLGALAAHFEASDASASAGSWAPYAAAAGSELQCLDICITEVEGVTGDAQVSMIRGKKKHLCDYSVDLKWSLSMKHAAADAVQTVAGKLSVLDISADKEYEVSAVEVTHFNGNPASLSALPKHAGLLVNAYVRKGGAGLQQLIHDALMAFCDDLKSK